MRVTRTMMMIWLVVMAACSGAVDSEQTPAPVEGENQSQMLSQPPAKPDPGARYLFYLHGRIIEEMGPRPEHPQFGIYEYQRILESLSQPGMVVVSEVRASGTDPQRYAEQVKQQVEELIAAGVPPEQITVVGFSKGGAIAILTSAMLDNDRVNYVFIAACSRWLMDRPELVPHGRILSLYEQSDRLGGSCQLLFDRRDDDLTHHELELQIGGGHGAFYRPDARWLEPLVEWAASASQKEPS